MRDKQGRFTKDNPFKFKKGYIPPSKIQDEYTDLPISRQRKYRLRRKHASVEPEKT